MTDVYWSSTTYPEIKSTAWSFHFDVCIPNIHINSNRYYARCVRGGLDGKAKQEVAVKTSRLTYNGNGTVTERRTHLIWQQGKSSPLTWNAAVTYCKELTVAGSNDWRLPNKMELTSLYDAIIYTPSIMATMFPGQIPSEYWSSTTIVYGTVAPEELAFSLNFKDGSRGDKLEKREYYVRCVRGGQ